jgi:hypothetical protein
MHNPQAIAAAQQMRAAEPQVLAVLSQVPGLDPRTRQTASAFLAGFFADIATDADITNKVLKSCLR